MELDKFTASCRHHRGSIRHSGHAVLIKNNVKKLFFYISSTGTEKNNNNLGTYVPAVQLI